MNKYDPLGKARTKLPPDLYAKSAGRSFNVGGEGNSNDPMEKLLANSDVFLSTFILERGFVGRNITVGTTPVQIVDGKFMRGYILNNPSPAVGLTTSGTIFASALRTGTGNSQATPVGVAGYDTARVFLNVTGFSGVGAVIIDAQTQDPVSLNWFDAQNDIFGSPAATGNFYANLGDIGVDNSLAFSFEITSTNATFSMNYVLKGGLPGSGSGLPNTIYLGPDRNVNSSTGYQLQEGKEKAWWFRPNAELWAVSLVSTGVTLSVFDLQ